MNCDSNFSKVLIVFFFLHPAMTTKKAMRGLLLHNMWFIHLFLGGVCLSNFLISSLLLTVYDQQAYKLLLGVWICL